MKVKKLLVTLSSALLLLCSCSPNISVPPIMGNGGDGGNKSPEKEQEEIEKTANPIDTYLVLSSIGLYNGEKGKNIEQMNLENAVIFNAKPGEALPTSEQISTIDGSSGVFQNWVCYEGTGFPTVYTTVPNEAGKILYASFTKTGASSGGSEEPSGGSGSQTNKLTPIYLDATQKLNADNDQNWASGNAAITMYVWSYTTGDSSWIKMNSTGNGIFVGSVNLEKYTNVIFLRHAEGSTASFEDGGYWNKTGSLLFVADKNCFKITSWNDGGVWTNK